MESEPVHYVHSISEAGRLLPSASRWNSIEIEFNLLPQYHGDSLHQTPSNYSKSFDFNLSIGNREHFKRFIYISVAIVLAIIFGCLLVKFLPRKHTHHSDSKNLTLALNKALLFFDAQKSGPLPSGNPVKFRGDSGLSDGKSGEVDEDLIGGFYDSGNNIKFSFPMAYTITLLSWSVIEYHEKYDAIGELDHAKDIIKWGSDYLLKVFVPPNSTTNPGILYSQVGTTSSRTNISNDINCWQRPEDMTYERPISVCDNSASDLAGETIAALSAASLVFKEEKTYSVNLTQAAEKLFDFATKANVQGTYTAVEDCGGEARKFYNSSGYFDELVWGGTWLFLSTGNTTYLDYATKFFVSATDEELTIDRGVFYWNNKLPAIAVLLTRIRYFRDLGYPYEPTLGSSSNITDTLMCSYLSIHSSFTFRNNFNATPGGLIILKPDDGALLEFVATTTFLTKLYHDYLENLQILGGKCDNEAFSLKMLQSFSTSQVEYILGDNPMKMSYLVGFGDHFPTHVHHRSASIPVDDQRYSCTGGKRWLYSKDPNPNILVGGMVAGPDKDDKFSDERGQPEYTQPSISGNAGLVAALIALRAPSSSSTVANGGIDPMGIFTNIHI